MEMPPEPSVEQRVWKAVGRGQLKATRYANDFGRRPHDDEIRVAVVESVMRELTAASLALSLPETREALLTDVKVLLDAVCIATENGVELIGPSVRDVLELSVRVQDALGAPHVE